MKRVVFLFLLVTFIVTTMAVPLFAQDNRVTLGNTGTYLIDIVGSVASAVVTGLIGWMAAAFTRKTGIEIEAKHREALHSAAMTGVTLALSKLKGTASTIGVEVKNDVVRSGVSWVIQSVPDAIKYFGLENNPDKIAEIVQSKIGALQEESVKVNVPAGGTIAQGSSSV